MTHADADVEGAISDLFRGPIADFVSRRDSLVKALRSSGDRESSAAVKALRKPSRTAWALNLAVLEDPDTIDALEAAIRDSQSAGADVRETIGSVRSAVRNFAIEASRVSADAGQAIDANVLTAALSAILGQAESFEQLRLGRLADVPDAGGLDLLGSLPTLSSAPPAASPATPKVPTKPHAAADSSKEDARRVAARARGKKAASEFASAQEHAGKAQEALRSAEAAVRDAETEARKADRAADRARRELGRARQVADVAAAALETAQAAVKKAGQDFETT